MTGRFIKKYGTKLIVPIYMVFYLTAFFFLEKRGMYRMNVIHTSIDYKIPFCEYFIIPYILWFFYIGFTVLWFMFKNKNEKEYMQLILNLGIGMTVFLLVSWLFPNGHLLRPASFPRENIFTDMVRLLYQTDTSTNILPSIHAYNSVVAFTAIARCKSLKEKPMIVGGTFLLTVSIILSTLFLKQHTVVDVIAAFVLNFVVYIFIYFVEDHKLEARSKAALNAFDL